MRPLTTTLGALLLSALSTVTFLACNGDGALTPEEQIARFCDDGVPPFCEAVFGCCTDATVLAAYGNVEGCKTNVAESCNSTLTDTLLPQIKAGNTVLDEARLEACITRLESMKAGGAACVEPSFFTFTIDCLAAFQGTIAPGAPCDVSRIPIGADTFLPCEDGICQNGKCQAFLATGDACTPALKDPAVGPLCNFADGEWCIGSGATGHCGPRGKVGEVCGVPGDENTLACESTICGPDGKCLAANGTELCAAPE